MSSLSFLFSLPLLLTMSFTIIFSGRKQPCILHFLLFPMKQQHCLYPVCHCPLPPLISAVSPLSHTFLLMCNDACQVRCSSGKPTPVTLHISHFWHGTHYYMDSCTSPFLNIYHKPFFSRSLHIASRHTCIILHMHITRYHTSFQSHTDMFMKTTQVFRLATNHTTQFTLIQIK